MTERNYTFIERDRVWEQVMISDAARNFPLRGSGNGSSPVKSRGDKPR